MKVKTKLLRGPVTTQMQLDIESTSEKTLRFRE